MALKPAVRLRLRDGATFEKAVSVAGEPKMSDIAPTIAQLAQQVMRHADDPWIQIDGGGCVKAEAVVAIEPIDEPTA
jgi:hypothetical protein